MSKFEFNDYIIAIDEPYENDYGYVAIGKKQSNGINIVFGSPNEKTVNWFIELQKYITNLQTQLEQQKAMWNELKEFVGKYADTYDESISSICFLILDKMQELEKGVEE